MRVSRPHANGGKRCRTGRAGLWLLIHDRRSLNRPITLLHRRVRADVAGDTEYSHAWPLGAPISGPNSRPSLYLNPAGLRGFAPALSVPTYPGWLRSGEGNAKKPHKQWPCVLPLYPHTARYASRSFGISVAASLASCLDLLYGINDCRRLTT
jgi:hypothetical protein